MAKKPGFLSDSMRRGGGEVIASGRKEITLSLVPEALVLGRVKFPTAETAEVKMLQVLGCHATNYCPVAGTLDFVTLYRWAWKPAGKGSGFCVWGPTAHV